MTFTWTYLTAAGDPVPGQPGSQAFPTQSDAESWIGETWRELLDGGVDAVLLREDDHVVYGPMSLHPAD